MLFGEEFLEEFFDLFVLHRIVEVDEGGGVIGEFVEDDPRDAPFPFLLQVGELRRTVHRVGTTEEDPEGRVLVEGHPVQLPHDVQQHHRAFLFSLNEALRVDVLPFVIEAPGVHQAFEVLSFCYLVDRLIGPFLIGGVGHEFRIGERFCGISFTDLDAALVPALEFLDQPFGDLSFIREDQPIGRFGLLLGVRFEFA